MSATVKFTPQNQAILTPNGPSGAWNSFWTLLLVCAAALAVIAPSWFLGNPSGHDIQFHIASWIDIHGQWREGILFPRWAEWANWGYGEPRFIFYPPASWILGAILGSVVPWRAATIVFVFIGLVAGGMSARLLARDWMPGASASAAAVFYAVNPYQVANVYYRSDYAELLAFVFFPLLVRGALGSLRGGWSSATLVAMPFAAMWLSNAPAGVLATYSLGLILATGCLIQKKWSAGFPGAAGMALGFGLAAFYILPAAWEQKWVQIGQVISTDLQPVHNFLFIRHADPEFLYFNLKMSFIALVVIFLTALAAVFVARRRKEFPELWWTLLGLGIASSILMFSPTAIVWRWLPKLQFIQFPWRWLGPLGLVFALFAAAASPRGKMGRRAWFALVTLAIVGAGVAVGSDTWWDTEDANYIVDSVQTGKGYEGTDEYTPTACDRYDLPEAGPRISRAETPNGEVLPLEAGAVMDEIWTAERIEFEVDAAVPETLVLRRLNYPAWEGTVDSKPAALVTRPKTGEIELNLAQGHHEVEIHFGQTRDRAAGGLISLISALLLAGMESARRKKTSARIPAG